MLYAWQGGQLGLQAASRNSLGQVRSTPLEGYHIGCAQADRVAAPKWTSRQPLLPVN
jgi:hypothetical protein